MSDSVWFCRKWEFGTAHDVNGAKGDPVDALEPEQ